MSTNPARLKHALQEILSNPLALDYVNPKKQVIVTCDDQARELSEMLRGLLGQQAEVTKVA